MLTKVLADNPSIPLTCCTGSVRSSPTQIGAPWTLKRTAASQSGALGSVAADGGNDGPTAAVPIDDTLEYTVLQNNIGRLYFVD